MLQVILFWAFQVVTGLSSGAMFLFPRRTHESLMPDPEIAYSKIGFSKTATEMVHNVMRAQGAALLAIVIFLFFLGPQERLSFLLIGIAAALTLVSHLMTFRHHVKSPVVMEALGSIKSMYPLLALNFFFAAGGFYLFWAAA